MSDEITSLPYANGIPFSTATPFTYREGATNLQLIHALKIWAGKVVPELNDALNLFWERYMADHQAILDDIANTKEQWQALFDAFMQNVLSELQAMNDPVVAALINDATSETHEAIQLMLLFDVRPLVYDLVAQAIANDQTIVETANEAVADAMERADVITGDDPRAAKTISPDIRWAIPFTDENGEVSAGFTKLGVFETIKIPKLSGDFIRGVDPRALIELSPDSPWAFAVTDGAGNVILGVKKDGAFFTAGGANGESRSIIACKGDSLVRGYTNSTAWPIEDSWPYLLGQMLDGVTVINAGYGGRTIDDIRFLVGEDALWVDALQNDVIPASGTVTAAVNRKFGSAPGRESTYFGDLQGINGNLTRLVDGGWTFTRTSAGASVPFTEPAILQRNVLYPSATSILWAARNDFNYDVLGNEDSVLEHAKTSMREWVNQLPGNNPQFVIVSVVNQTAEVQGSVRYNTIIAFNQWVKETYPGRYIEIRSWLVHEAIYELGLTPTAEDLAAIAADAPPPQIMDGGSHHTKPVAPLIAEIFKNWILGKGYV